MALLVQWPEQRHGRSRAGSRQRVPAGDQGEVGPARGQLGREEQGSGVRKLPGGVDPSRKFHGCLQTLEGELPLLPPNDGEAAGHFSSFSFREWEGAENPRPLLPTSHPGPPSIPAPPPLASPHIGLAPLQKEPVIVFQHLYQYYYYYFVNL